MTKFGYDLKELYEYSLKELLFILKYRREGFAYQTWRMGTMVRAAMSKTYPQKVEEAIPEMFEKKTVDVKDLPKWMQEDYIKTLQEQVNSRVKRGG